jgi:hypothetical protein
MSCPSQSSWLDHPYVYNNNNNKVPSVLSTKDIIPNKWLKLLNHCPALYTLTQKAAILNTCCIVENVFCWIMNTKCLVSDPYSLKTN